MMKTLTLGIIGSKHISKIFIVLTVFVTALLIVTLILINNRLEIEGSGKSWKQDQKVRLHHVDTNGYLHSHDKKYSRAAGGQQEVCI